jgi:hypothetical protein
MKKQKIVTILGLAVLGAAALANLGCHSSSPTSANGDEISVAVIINNAAAASTILEAQLLFDGITVTDYPTGVPVASVTLTAAGTAAVGPHSMGIVMVNQLTTPNKYTIAPTIQVYDSNGNFLRSQVLTPQTVSVATGQTVTFNFVL